MIFKFHEKIKGYYIYKAILRMFQNNLQKENINSITYRKHLFSNMPLIWIPDNYKALNIHVQNDEQLSFNLEKCNADVTISKKQKVHDR